VKNLLRPRPIPPAPVDATSSTAACAGPSLPSSRHADADAVRASFRGVTVVAGVVDAPFRRDLAPATEDAAAAAGGLDANPDAGVLLARHADVRFGAARTADRGTGQATGHGDGDSSEDGDDGGSCEMHDVGA